MVMSFNDSTVVDIDELITKELTVEKIGRRYHVRERDVMNVSRPLSVHGSHFLRIGFRGLIFCKFGIEGMFIKVQSVRRGAKFTSGRLQ
jgi:hypothetical protein